MKGASALRLQAMPLFSQEANSNFEAAVEGFNGCPQSYRICSVDRWRNIRAGIKVERVVVMELTIGDDLRTLVPNLSLGVILATVHVSGDTPELSSAISKYIHDLQLSMKSEDLAAIPEIMAARNGYRAIGKDPSRYRPSQEALLRRVMQGKGLFKINSAVDVNNLNSLRSRHSLGSYDLDQTKGATEFRIGLKGESYKGIGKKTINLEGLPVFADDLGPFGSPTSDSERAMIRLTTTRVMMAIISFAGKDRLHNHITSAAELLKVYANATIQETGII
jgi:DNA/RNA-binding domain of Phe-tRNA-synthetase-like protein